jgi:hypothetical protein
MFDPFACASSIKEDLISYITSSLPVGNQSSQVKLGEAFYREWSQELFKGPFVEALPKYETLPSLADQFKKLPENRAARNAFWALLRGPHIL